MLALTGHAPQEQPQGPADAPQQQEEQQQQQHRACGDAAAADEAEDADQFDALMTMLKFGELCKPPAGAERSAPGDVACGAGHAAVAVKADALSAAGAEADSQASAGSAAAAAAGASAGPAPVEAAPAAGGAADDAPGAAGTLMELGFMAALAAATKVGAGPPRRGNSADSSGTRVGGPGRGPSQDSVSNGGGQGEEEEEEERQQQQQWLRHQGPAQLHSPGEQEFAAAAALAAAAAAAQEEAEVDADAARRGRRLRAAKRRQHDVAEGSDLEDEGLGLDDLPGGDGGRGGKRRRGGAARGPKVPKGERKYTSSELSIAIFEAEGVFNMRLDDAARQLGFGSPTSIKKAMARLRITKWPNRTRETAKNILTGLEEYLKRYCDADTTTAVMDRANARLQPYLSCTTAIELSEDLRKLRQKVYKLKDQDHDQAYTEASMRRCVERLVEDIMSQGFARSPSPAAGV
ncbi:hypothetical protein ABPG77_010268 [Micractinium sp. CCAP 211/92]